MRLFAAASARCLGQRGEHAHRLELRRHQRQACRALVDDRGDLGREAARSRR